MLSLWVFVIGATLPTANLEADFSGFRVQANTSSRPDAVELTRRHERLQRVVESMDTAELLDGRVVREDRHEYLFVKEVLLYGKIAEVWDVVRDLDAYPDWIPMPTDLAGESVEYRGVLGHTASRVVVLYMYFGRPFRYRNAYRLYADFVSASDGGNLMYLTYQSDHSAIKRLEMDFLFKSEADGSRINLKYLIRLSTNWKGVFLSKRGFERSLLPCLSVFEEALTEKFCAGLIPACSVTTTTARSGHHAEDSDQPIGWSDESRAPILKNVLKNVH